MRPRKARRDLPPCMYQKHGSYYLVKRNVWTRLASDLPTALAKYARLVAPRTSGGMDDLIFRWEAQLSMELAKSTREQYRFAAEKIRTAFAEFSPGDILPTDVAQFLDSLRDTPNMANRTRSVLKLMMDCAVRWGDATHNPVTSIRRFEEEKRDRYITDDEYHAIRTQCRPWLQCVIDLCYLTGQRIEDVLSIKLEHITSEGINFKQGKTGQRLLIASSPALKDAIVAAKAVASGYPKSDYLVPARGGKKRDYRTTRDAWAAACVKAKVSDAHLHDLRAKSLTDADGQGLNAQLLGGHANPQMTERYIRLRRTIVAESPKAVRKVLDRP